MIHRKIILILEIHDKLYSIETISSENSVSTFAVLIEWNIHSVDTLTNNMIFMRNGTDCYLSFDSEGYLHNNLCTILGMGSNVDLVFSPIF